MPSLTTRLRLTLLALAVGGLHVLGWGLLLAAAAAAPAVAALGGTAYLLGLRHGFDADHITTIDATTRKLFNDGQQPLAVGFFFALGHSTVVFALAIGAGIAAATVAANLDAWGAIGNPIGVSVSGLFLALMGALNLLVLIDLLAAERAVRNGSEVASEALGAGLGQRGPLARILARAGRGVRSSLAIFPVGVLFGLGFDTATEIGLLALTAGASASAAPFWAVLALPCLFAAGMTLVDTGNGLLISRAYSWTAAAPLRRLRYNLTITGISAVLALSIAGVQLFTLVADGFAVRDGLAASISGLDFERLGYAIVATTIAVWGLAYLASRRRQPRLAGGAN